MKFKLNGKSFLAIVFVAMILLGGILTFLFSPVEILGGLVRGYLNAPEESNILQKIGASTKTFDNRMNLYFAFQDASIHAYGGVQKLLGHSLVYDVDENYRVLSLENGYLTFQSKGNHDLTGLKDYLLDLQASSDSKFMYVGPYNKDTTDVELIPPFYPYSSSSNLGEMEAILKDNGICILNYEEAAQQQNIDKYPLFFKTDHHWTPKAGVWAAQNICAKINASYGWDLDTDIYDLSNYNIRTYPKAFLGSQGKRVGAIYAGVDDFDVITPKFDTHLTVEMKNPDFYGTGDFEQMFIFEENITPDQLLNKAATAYDTYMQGNHSLVTITNHNTTNEKTALFIIDSYGCVVAPYLSMAFRQLDCIDIRSYSGSVKEYIKATSPDIVIYAISNHQ